MRTAEELGRAFPGKPVVTSSGENIKAMVPDTPALVVATVGAEPVAPAGYAAALLLDGNSLLRRENLRAGEDTVRRWFNAASLVKPAGQGGLVVITADDTAATGALLRWDAAGYASRELALRRELQLPPAVRVASVTGSRADVGHFSEAFEASAPLASGAKLRSAGPAPVQLFTGTSPLRPKKPMLMSGRCTSFRMPKPQKRLAPCVLSKPRTLPSARPGRCSCAWTGSTSSRRQGAGLSTTETCAGAG